MWLHGKQSDSILVYNLPCMLSWLTTLQAMHILQLQESAANCQPNDVECADEFGSVDWKVGYR